MNQIEYDSASRMKYNPEFHAKHNTEWLMVDHKYLIKHYDTLGAKHCGFALERTQATLSYRVSKLRKSGVMPKFRAGLKKRVKRTCIKQT